MTNQQRSGEKGSRSLAVALLVQLCRTILRCSNLPGAYKLGFASYSISFFFGGFYPAQQCEMANLKNFF